MLKRHIEARIELLATKDWLYLLVYSCLIFIVTIIMSGIIYIFLIESVVCWKAENYMNRTFHGSFQAVSYSRAWMSMDNYVIISSPRFRGQQLRLHTQGAMFTIHKFSYDEDEYELFLDRVNLAEKMKNQLYNTGFTNNKVFVMDTYDDKVTKLTILIGLNNMDDYERMKLFSQVLKGYEHVCGSLIIVRDYYLEEIETLEEYERFETRDYILDYSIDFYR